MIAAAIIALLPQILHRDIHIQYKATVRDASSGASIVGAEVKFMAKSMSAPLCYTGGDGVCNFSLSLHSIDFPTPANVAAAAKGYIPVNRSMELMSNYQVEDIRLDKLAEISTPSKVGGPLKVTLVGLSSPSRPGERATITAKTAPHVECTIEVQYSSGRSRAQGLEPKLSDETGIVTWTWRIGQATKPGSWPIAVECTSGSHRAQLGATHIKIE